MDGAAGGGRGLPLLHFLVSLVPDLRTAAGDPGLLVSFSQKMDRRNISRQRGKIMREQYVNVLNLL